MREYIDATIEQQHLSAQLSYTFKIGISKLLFKPIYEIFFEFHFTKGNNFLGFKSYVLVLSF